MPSNTSADKPRFCTNCGTQVNPDARFCHMCGAAIQGRQPGASSAPQGRSASAPSTPGASRALRWGVPALAFVALVALSAYQLSREAQDDPAGTLPPGMGAAQAPDISSMSPEERADRLFNRVMRLSSEGKADSAAFFAPMAVGALEAVTPLTAHGRYDIGLVSLATGDVSRAAAQADTILAQRPTHLLGLVLAARVADVRGDAAASASFRQRLLAAEPAERGSALPEYNDHNADILDAVAVARSRR